VAFHFKFKLGVMLWLYIVGGAGIAFAQQPPAGKAVAKGTAEKPQAAASQPPPWGSRCVALTRESALDCLVEQKLIVANTGQLLGAVTIRIPNDTKQPVLMIQTPIGLYLPAGVTVDVDGADRLKFKFQLQTCDANGCYVGSPMPKGLLDRMEKGQKLNVVFQNLQKQPITMSMALAGFAEAYQKVR
jgi:invasion protein IalB